MINADMLFYGGCWVLQTGNINLAFTDSFGRALDAAKEMGVTCEPYWTSYTIKFDTPEDRASVAHLIDTTCGGAYLSPFVGQASEQSITLSGYCIL